MTDDKDPVYKLIAIIEALEAENAPDKFIEPLRKKLKKILTDDSKVDI